MDEKMKAVAIVDDHKAELKMIKKLPVRPGKILMKVNACALCTFEQRMFIREKKVPLPFIGGHEIIGEISAVGEGVNKEKYPVGKKIAARLMQVCGECYYCRHGEENLCVCANGQQDPDLEIIGMGGLAEFINIDPSQAYFMDENIPDTVGCFSEPLACVLQSINRGNIHIGDDVVVIGGGIMGMLHVMCAKLSGARVIISEPDEARRELALELGADIAINPIETDPVKYMKDLNGVGAEVVFNTTPISSVAKQAQEMVAPMGTVVMYSSQHPDKPIEVSPNWLHNSESILTGSVSPSVRSFTDSVNLLNKRLLDPTKLVSGVYSAEECQEAFEVACRPDTFRVVITF